MCVGEWGGGWEWWREEREATSELTALYVHFQLCRFGLRLGSLTPPSSDIAADDERRLDTCRSIGPTEPDNACNNANFCSIQSVARRKKKVKNHLMNPIRPFAIVLLPMGSLAFGLMCSHSLQ